MDGPLGTLAFSQVKPHGATASLRAVKWHEDLERFGLELPFAIVHDIGLVLTADASQLSLGPRCDISRIDPGMQQLIPSYQSLVQEIQSSEAARRAPQLKLSDDLVVVLLARILGNVAEHNPQRAPYASRLPLDANLFERLDAARLQTLYRTFDRSYERAALGTLVEWALLVVTLTDALDLDTLRLFGMLGAGTSGSFAQVDLFNSLEAPEANDIVNFSLEILPSVLETKAKPAASSVAAFGYSGLGRRGSIDNLVLTELAWDDAEFSRRLADNEVLYYAREKQYEQEGREHLLLVDASASMRGDRATFARAMAMATGKKLLLEGERVGYRFFDSRLYEAANADAGELPTAHLLTFKGERGRNTARVFRELIEHLSAKRRSQAPVLHIFTHAALHVPRDLVEQLTRLTEVSAIFMLPSSGALNLSYLDLLTAHWVVDHASLAQSDDRAQAAIDILHQDRNPQANSSSSNRASSTTSMQP